VQRFGSPKYKKCSTAKYIVHSLGNRMRAGKQTISYETSQPGKLSLAIPPWPGAMSTSEIWGVNRHSQ